MDEDRPGELARLTEAVVGLEQAVSGMAGILEQHGRMLQRLLDASTRAPGEDARLHELVLALTARLDAKAEVLGRMERSLTEMG